MADTELGELYGTASGGTLSTVSTWAGMLGAATSLALVVGVGFWSYKLFMRDVNGIPVIEAIAGPMRIQPKDPGGEQMAFQGLAVNHVAADGEAGALPQEVVLAPAEPQLLDHDLSSDELKAAQIPDFSAATTKAVAAALAAPLEDSAIPQPAVQTAVATAADLAPGATPAVATAEDAAGALPAVAVISTSIPGVRHSPRPPDRPQALVLAAAAIAAPAPPPPDVEISPDALPAGSRLVQLGAFPSKDQARDAWIGIADRYPEVMAGKKRVIMEASAAGETFYRLRAVGFADSDDTRRFCATLDAQPNHPLCVPVAPR